MKKGMLQNSPLYAYIPAKDVARAGTSRASQAFWQVDDIERGGNVIRGQGHNSCCTYVQTEF